MYSIYEYNRIVFHFCILMLNIQNRRRKIEIENLTMIFASHWDLLCRKCRAICILKRRFHTAHSTLCDSVWGWTSTRMTGIKIDPTRVRNCFCACSCLPVRLRRETIEIASGSFEISFIFLRRISNADD